MKHGKLLKLLCTDFQNVCTYLYNVVPEQVRVVTFSCPVCIAGVFMNGKCTCLFTNI